MAIYLNPADCEGLKRHFLAAASRERPALVKYCEPLWILDKLDPGKGGWFPVMVIDNGIFDVALLVDNEAERRSQIREMAGDEGRQRRVEGYACRWDWIQEVAPDETSAILAHPTHELLDLDEALKN